MVMNTRKLNLIIKESINKILLEQSSEREKQKYIKRLYKFTEKFTKQLYTDENWENVSNILSEIEEFIHYAGTLGVRVYNGGYWKPFGSFPNYKEYNLTIELFNGIEINGSLKCHAAGSMDDIFSKYDVTISFY